MIFLYYLGGGGKVSTFYRPLAWVIQDHKN